MKYPYTNFFFMPFGALVMLMGFVAYAHAFYVVLGKVF